LEAQEVEQTPESTNARPLAQRPFLIGILAVLTIGVSVIAVFIYNYVVVDKPLQRVLATDSRNAGFKEHAHFENWTNPNIVVFNLESAPGSASRLDVLRTLLQYAQAMKDQRFRKVVLAYRGNNKFQMDGAYFQELGAEFDTQNPMYTIRTFPIHMTTMDGSSPYSEYEGGILGVLKKEMEQFADFSDRWYGNDMAILGDQPK
jgi:hypothetical protein